MDLDPSAPLPPHFPYGVASGDPLTDRVVIWTRVLPDEEGEVELSWQVALDARFEDLVVQGGGTTTAAVDYTAKVDVEGLEPGTTYYYRFLHAGESSPVGRTLTLPAGSPGRVTLAVVSCASFPSGLFHVYREVGALDIDAVLHLGDYIYEYGMGEFGTETAVALDRVPDPEVEVTTLDGYRRRYAQYRRDRDLSNCHAAHPFICVWDDHEVANDAYRDGAQNHSATEEGDFEVRKRAALRAYFEWMPIRPPQNEEEIYRLFSFGDLVDLVMLDTRHVGRDRQISYGDFMTTDGIDVEAAREAIAEGERTMLGADQKEWLRQRLEGATARWQVLGQQVLFGRYELPAEFVSLLDPENLGDDAIDQGTRVVLSAAIASDKAPQDRTAEEQALLDETLPYNLDAWDGYPAERDEILDLASSLGSRLIVLAGDTHNAWASTLTSSSGSVVGAEFGTPSVTSPGLEGILGAGVATLFEEVALRLVPELSYVNLRNRGYLWVEFEPDRVAAEFRFVDSVTEVEYSVADELTERMTIDSDLTLARVT